MKCQMVFKLFGMKHLQALMLGFVYALDMVNLLAIGDLADKKRVVPPSSIPLERATGNDHDMVAKWQWLALAAGHGLIAPLILRVNNKYILLALTVLEMVALLIGHAMYIQKGLAALQYTYLAVLFIQGTRWPLAMNILSKWSTSSTFTLVLFIFNGSHAFFTAVYYLIVRSLREYGIMTMSVYLSVIIKGTFCVLWIVFGSGDPIHNVFVSKEELVELRDEHRLRLKCLWKTKVPWKKMLKTPILYGCFVLHTAYLWFRTWSEYDFVATFARFRKTGGWIHLFFYILQIIATGAAAYCIDLIIKKKKIPLNNIRKTCAGISAWGGGVCFLMTGANLGKSTATTAFMGLNDIFQICNGLYDAVPILYAISPNYLGLTYSIISCIANLSLGLVPIVDKFLVGDGKDTTRAMSLLLYFYGSFIYFGCLLMLMTGTCKRREYDSFNTVPWKEDSILSFP